MRTMLARERQKAGYTQYSFADALDISRSHYSQIESGLKNPSLKLSMKIKQTLHVKGDEIFFDYKRPVLRHKEN